MHWNGHASKRYGIGSMPWMSSDLVRTTFEEFGTVQDVFIPGSNPRAHGVAFVSFGDRDHAADAFSKLDGEEFSDRHGNNARVSIDWAVKGGAPWKSTTSGKKQPRGRFETSAEHQGAVCRPVSETIGGLARDIGNSFSLSDARTSRFKHQAARSGDRAMNAALRVSQTTSREALRAELVRSLLQHALPPDEVAET